MENKISSVENQLVKSLVKLKNKDDRIENKEFIIEGIKLIEEAISNNIKINYVFIDIDLTDKFIDLISRLEKLNISVYPVTDNVLKKVSDFVTPQGMVCVAQLPDFADIKSIKSNGKYIALEGIQDPGNVGTIIRTADGSGLDGVIVDKSCADVFSSKTLRGSMGSVFRLPVYFAEDLADFINLLKDKGLTVYAAMADQNGVEVQSAFLEDKGYVVVIGNEGAGISEKTALASDNSIYIPMKGKAQSFNAALAGGIIIWEMTK